MSTVRPFQPGDTAQTALTMARAFADYPYTLWTVQAEDRHERLRGLYTLFVAEFSASLGGVWVTDDCAAVASWLPPGVVGPDEAFQERHGATIVELMGDRLPAAMAAAEIVDPMRPAEPHWYLASMGTHPDWQNRGLGSRVLEPVLSRCDAEGVPAFTETATEANVRFYRRAGFDVVAEAELPDGGPRLWFLYRRPEGSR
ncbi:GNAT family N-acetyltransferase [Streptosporangium carneum]|uniref:N-acetyltransferase n=1 Tax=Streptosporangium carneum TaxID=47481 RepID=A0A9W6MD11_9ACTN|nr:GNAT family N-acetyltransferase [Streptosporangium carneum]GLK09597.1 N-acetyltransferase [Streptosporangium carneum]